MKEFIAGESENGLRLDRFLKKLLPWAPLALIYKLPRTNRAKVDGKKRDGDYRLSSGEIVKIFLTDEEFGELGLRSRTLPERDGNGFEHPWRDTKPKEKTPVKRKFVLTKDRILFEDADVLAINKPAWVNVHPGDHKSDENSVIEAVSDYLDDKFDTLTFRPSLVHRIDRDTSGVLLIAKNKRSLDRLLDALQNDKMDKTYAMIATKTPRPESGTVRKKLLRVEGAKNEAKVRVDDSGAHAVTHYRTKQKNVAGKYALVECRIETGRTHQIRVHMASLDCPVLGDRAYGDIGENSHAKRRFGIDRQLLHAWKLSFPHPTTWKTTLVEAPFEADMAKILTENTDSER